MHQKALCSLDEDSSHEVRCGRQDGWVPHCRVAVRCTSLVNRKPLLFQPVYIVHCSEDAFAVGHDSHNPTLVDVSMDCQLSHIFGKWSKNHTTATIIQVYKVRLSNLLTCLTEDFYLFGHPNKDIQSDLITCKNQLLTNLVCAFLAVLRVALDSDPYSNLGDTGFL